MNISFILDKALQLYADKEAVVCDNKRFTYRQFAARIDRLACVLSKKGVGKGDCVAVIHQNSHEFLEAYYAVARIGAILNPINTRLSPSEIAFILKDSNARILISAKRFKESIQTLENQDTSLSQIIWTGEGDFPYIFESMDYEISIAEEKMNSIPSPEISDDDVVQLYYTSGTTGVPKGVMLTHKNICAHALGAIAELGLKDKDNWIHVAPLFHLADAWATFAITWVGGKHILVQDFDPSQVLSAIQKEKVTITNMIPTMLNILVNSQDCDSYDFSSFRAILSGGSPIAPELVRKVIDTFRCDYIQTYGMTETSPYLTMSILKENLENLPYEEQFKYKAKTGRPFIGVLLRVIREDGTDVEPDEKEVGEIIVKGDTVTRGYWNRPEETEGVLKDGWLHTGDMAVVDEDGYVNIVDRKKDIIITGGENVYSVEVENILYAHPCVLEVAVIGVPEPKWGETVKAIIVLKQNKSTTEQEIIEFCREQIAHYKAPKSITFVQEIPKTGSGKIYKKGLKEKYTTQ